MLIYLGVFFILPDNIKKKILSNSVLCATIIAGFFGGLYGISRYSTSEGFYQSSASGGCGTCKSIECKFTATLSATGALTNISTTSGNLIENMAITTDPSSTGSYTLPANTTLSSFSGSTGQLAGPASFTAVTDKFVGSYPTYCRINEKTFKTAEFDQTLIFNIYGRYVRIYAASTLGDGFFSLSQVIVNDAAGTNIALNKTATASSTQTNMKVVTFAGSGDASFLDGTGAAASFRDPHDIAIDSNGNLFVADLSNHRIRKITPAGVVTTFAGSGTPGSANGTGTAAQFSSPLGICIDSANNVYVADLYNNAIRKITPAGVVTTLSTGFNLPYGCAVDSVGNIYVASTYNHQIKKITPAGVVSVLAGTGATGGADGPGASATFTYPAGVAVHPTTGDIYVAGCDDSKIRKITPAGVVSTYAGTGTPGNTDGPAATATFNRPFKLIFDPAGNLYVADQGNSRIRRITTNGIVQTYAGTTPGFTDNVTADKAQFKWVSGLALAPGGNIYVADAQNHRIRLIQTAASASSASIAVDGTMNARSSVNIFENNNTGRATDYWQVDLGSSQMVSTVRVITRGDVVTTSDRNTGLRVVVLDSLTDTPTASGVCAARPAPVFPNGTAGPPTADEKAVIGPMILMGYNGKIALDIYRGIGSHPNSFTQFGLTDSQSAAAAIKIKTNNLMAYRAARTIDDNLYFSETRALKAITTMAGIPFDVSNELRTYMNANKKTKRVLDAAGKNVISTTDDGGREVVTTEIMSVLAPKGIDPAAGNSQATTANANVAIPPPPATGKWAESAVSSMPQQTAPINIPASGAPTTITLNMTPEQKTAAVRANNPNVILITPNMTPQQKAEAILAANASQNTATQQSTALTEEQKMAAYQSTSSGQGFATPTLSAAAGGQGQLYMRLVNVSYSGAAAKCTEYNGRLATQAQVQTAASKGASFPSHGWCSDNSTTVLYPKNNSVNSMSATASSYYVNCYGPKPPRGTTDVAPWTDVAKTADGATYTANDWSQRIFKPSSNTALPNPGTPLRTQEAYYVGGEQNQNLNREQSQQLCRNIGGTLATNAQLDNAKAAGANWCGSGWLNDTDPKQAGSNCSGASVTGAICFGIKPSLDVGATNVATISATNSPINVTLKVSPFTTSGPGSPSWSQTGASTAGTCQPGQTLTGCMVDGKSEDTCLDPGKTCATGCASPKTLSDGRTGCDTGTRIPPNCVAGSTATNCGSNSSPNWACLTAGQDCSSVPNNPGADYVKPYTIPPDVSLDTFTSIANKWRDSRKKTDLCAQGQTPGGDCYEYCWQNGTNPFYPDRVARYFFSSTPFGQTLKPIMLPVSYYSNILPLATAQYWRSQFTSRDGVWHQLNDLIQGNPATVTVDDGILDQILPRDGSFPRLRNSRGECAVTVYDQGGVLVPNIASNSQYRLTSPSVARGQCKVVCPYGETPTLVTAYLFQQRYCGTQQSLGAAPFQILSCGLSTTSSSIRS